MSSKLKHIFLWALLLLYFGANLLYNILTVSESKTRIYAILVSLLFCIYALLKIILYAKNKER